MDIKGREQATNLLVRWSFVSFTMRCEVSITKEDKTAFQAETLRICHIAHSINVNPNVRMNGAQRERSCIAWLTSLSTPLD